MGKVDRFIRILMVLVIAALYYSSVITGALAIGLLIVAIAFVITSFVGFCPLYLPFGFSTYKKKKAGTL